METLDSKCPQCGAEMKKTREAQGSNLGCVLMVVGVILLPAIIGFPIILWALHEGSKAKGFWLCSKCGTKIPRKLRWYELG
jgi:predicted RNA-binding Zn-ribbon protein involved in translation (DUF1610 family)